MWWSLPEWNNKKVANKAFDKVLNKDSGVIGMCSNHAAEKE